jgi:hypothetical protein
MAAARNLHLVVGFMAIIKPLELGMWNVTQCLFVTLRTYGVWNADCNTRILNMRPTRTFSLHLSNFIQTKPILK